MNSLDTLILLVTQRLLSFLSSLGLGIEWGQSQGGAQNVYRPPRIYWWHKNIYLFGV